MLSGPDNAQPDRFFLKSDRFGVWRHLPSAGKCECVIWANLLANTKYLQIGHIYVAYRVTLLPKHADMAYSCK